MASRPKSSQGVGGRSSPFLPAPRPQTAMGLSREPSSPRPKVRAAPITQLRLLLVAFCCGLPQRRRVPQGASAVGTGTKAHDATAEMQHRQTQRQTPFAPSIEAWGSSGAHESPLALKSSQSLSSNTNPLSYAGPSASLFSAANTSAAANRCKRQARTTAAKRRSLWGSSR